MVSTPIKLTKLNSEFVSKKHEINALTNNVTSKIKAWATGLFLFGFTEDLRKFDPKFIRSQKKNHRDIQWLIGRECRLVETNTVDCLNNSN